MPASSLQARLAVTCAGLALVACARSTPAPTSTAPDHHGMPSASRVDFGDRLTRLRQLAEQVPTGERLPEHYGGERVVPRFTDGTARTELALCERVDVAALGETEDAVEIASLASADWVEARWLDRDRLWRVAIVDTPLWQAPSDAGAGGARVTLHPGAIVDAAPDATATASASTATVAERARGWIDLDATGHVFRAAPRAPSPPATQQAWAPGVALRALPAADAPELLVATFSGPYRLLGQTGAWTEVAYEGDSLSATGFVPTAALAPPPHIGACEGGGSHYFIDGVSTLDMCVDACDDDTWRGTLAIPAGTCAWADGEVVAVARAPLSKAAAVRAGSAWTTVDGPAGRSLTLPVVPHGAGYAVAATSCTASVIH